MPMGETVFEALEKALGMGEMVFDAGKMGNA